MLLALVIVAVGCGSDDAQSPTQPTPTDQAPPLTPTGVGLASQSATKVVLRWAPNVDPDLAGYRVYLYDPSPDRSNAYRCLTPLRLWPTNEFASGAVDGTTYCYRITAVDTSGNESTMSDPLTFSFSSGDNASAASSGSIDPSDLGTTDGPGSHGWFPAEQVGTHRDR